LPELDAKKAEVKPDQPARKPDAPIVGGKGGLTQKLMGLGYEAGRSLLSPNRGDVGSEPVVSGPETIGSDQAVVPDDSKSSDALQPDPKTDVDATGVAAIPPQKRRMIRLGSRGREVTYAQERLNAHGATPPLGVDGIFGKLTRRAALDYQNSHALSADAIIGPKTWASLDGPTRVGTSGGQTKVGGGGGPGSTMLYDNSDYTFPPPPPGTKRDVPIAEIKKKQAGKSPELGKTIKVEGVAKNTEAEVHLYWIIARLGRRSRWASEVDLVTQVGFPPKTGGPAPKGRVTLRIDGQGNATASLLGSGAATVAATFTSKADGIKRLKASFGFADVKDGDASFTLDELNKVQAALSRLSSGEASALRGVVLKRMRAVMEDGKASAGVFKTEHSLSADGKTAISTAELLLADSAFSSDMKNFIGGAANAAPISFQTILHEVGHAVEEAERYKARVAEFEAGAEVNRKVEVFNQAVGTANDSLNELNKAWNDARTLFNAYKNAQKKTAYSYVKAMDVANTKLGALIRNRSVGQRSKVEHDARQAIALRDARKAALAKASPGHAALSDFQNASSRQDDSLKEGLKLSAADADWEAAKSKHSAAKKAVAATETGGDTKRLKRFAAFVAREKIPPLTNYAKTKTSEFYAEAFSLWRADPEYLKLAAPKLFTWFATGEHLK